ncbi:hypothetical protein NUW54_g13306 [Trametes sanguinea]|uniref:Uncharacterized protein n=1 Tax=Trametes sanguinea TaxID=158606 RepID=A0ACC1MPL3_9APHY|nr:hypothetical protein NUW54_g13306 [Trametes sanguinea]
MHGPSVLHAVLPCRRLLQSQQAAQFQPKKIRVGDSDLSLDAEDSIIHATAITTIAAAVPSADAPTAVQPSQANASMPSLIPIGSELGAARSITSQELAELEDAYIDYSGQAEHAVSEQPREDGLSMLAPSEFGVPQTWPSMTDNAGRSGLHVSSRLLPFQHPIDNLARSQRPHLYMPAHTTNNVVDRVGSALLYLQGSIASNATAETTVAEPMQSAELPMDQQPEVVEEASRPLPVVLHTLNDAVWEYLDAQYAVEAAELAKLFCVPPPYGSAYTRNQSTAEVHTALGAVLSITVADVVQWLRMGCLKNFRHARKWVTNLYTLQHDLRQASAWSRPSQPPTALSAPSSCPRTTPSRPTPSSRKSSTRRGPVGNKMAPSPRS